MASIKEQVSNAMKTSLKSGDKLTLTFARNLFNAIRKREIDDRVELDDGSVQKIISTLIKQRQESIDQFTKGGRMDLVEKETGELKFLQGFLPEQLSESEVKALIDQAVTETQASTPKDMGKVMQALMPKVQGRADGKMLSEWVRKRLGAG